MMVKRLNEFSIKDVHYKASKRVNELFKKQFGHEETELFAHHQSSLTLKDAYEIIKEDDIGLVDFEVVGEWSVAYWKANIEWKRGQRFIGFFYIIKSNTFGGSRLYDDAWSGWKGLVFDLNFPEIGEPTEK